jgi:hypothetical protein
LIVSLNKGGLTPIILNLYNLLRILISQKIL